MSRRGNEIMNSNSGMFTAEERPERYDIMANRKSSRSSMYYLTLIDALNSIGPTKMIPIDVNKLPTGITGFRHTLRCYERRLKLQYTIMVVKDDANDRVVVWKRFKDKGDGYER